MCRQSIRDLRHETEKLSTRLAMRKAQKSFLESADTNVCTSLLPKVGKSFSNPVLEQRKRHFLDECRKQLVKLGIEAATSNRKIYVPSFTISLRILNPRTPRKRMSILHVLQKSRKDGFYQVKMRNTNKSY